VFGAGEVDSDGDGLSDFQEVHKYFTNPTSADSDGDGSPDGDWHERREYAYTVRSVVKVMRPCNLEAINDDYQDGRVLAESKQHVELEVVHYPFNTNGESIEGDPAWRARAAEMHQWVDPGVTTNWDTRMRENVLAELKEAGIDVEALTDRELVERMAPWALRRARGLNKVFTTYYVHFPEGQPAVYPGLEEAFQREFHRDSANYEWEINRHFDHELLGREMFYNKTHGSCTSFAVYQTTLLRAAGIPARMIVVIPIVDPTDDKQIQLIEDHIAHPEVREILLSSLKGNAGFIAHTLNEVYIGQRWRRLDYSTLGRNTYGPRAMGMVTHVHTFRDLSDANLTATWGVRYAKGLRDDVFAASNPYRTTELSDRIGIHCDMKIPRPRQTWEKTGNIRILSAYWWNDLPADDWRRRSVSPERDKERRGNLLLHVDSTIGTRLNNQQVIALLSRVDRNMHLVDDQGRRIPLQIRAGSVWTGPEGGAELEVAIPEAAHSQLASKTEYSLVFVNAEDYFQWEVAEDVKVAIGEAVGAGAPNRSPAGGESPTHSSSPTERKEDPSESSTPVSSKTDSTAFSKEEIRRFPYALDFRLGASKFREGDSITISGIRGTRPTFEVGGDYLVKGRYTLTSCATASLCFYRTTKERVGTRTHPSQVTKVRRGTGGFSLVKPIQHDGYLHLSFYSMQGDRGRVGGVYFGQNDRDTWTRSMD
jgi:hypothetical protein